MIINVPNQLDIWKDSIIYGRNGSGKTTSSQIIARRLTETGKKVCLFSSSNFRSLLTTSGSSIFYGLNSAQDEAENNTIHLAYNCLKEIDPLYNKRYAFLQKRITINLLNEISKRETKNNYTRPFPIFFDLDALLIKEPLFKVPKNTKVLSLGKQFQFNKFISRLCSIAFIGEAGIQLDNNTVIAYIINTVKKSNPEILPASSKIEDLFAKKKETLIFSLKAKYGDAPNLVFLLTLFVAEEELRRIIYSKMYTEMVKQNPNVPFIIKKHSPNQYIKRNKIKEFRSCCNQFLKDFFSVSNQIRVLEGFPMKIVSANKSQKPIAPLENLSESEILRLCFSVVLAYMKVDAFDYYIFDDPFNSFDDYNHEFCCKVFSTILSSKCGWTVFLHDFQAFATLGSYLPRGRFLFYYDSVDISTISNLLKEENSSEEGTLPTPMNSIPEKNNGSYNSTSNSNPPNPPKNNFFLLNGSNASQGMLSEFSLFQCFISSDYCHKNKVTFDSDLAFIGLTLMLRNVVKDFIDIDHQIVVAKDGRKLIKNLSKLVSGFVEKPYLHYCPSSFPMLPYKSINSDNLKVCKVANLYFCLNKDKKSYSFIYLNNTQKMNCFREKVMLSRLSKIKNGNPLVNLMLSYATLIETIKYRFEKSLILELTKSHVAHGTINSVIKTHTLGRKIQFCKTKNIKNLPPQFLDDYNSIFSRFSSMMNDFDHSITRLLSPYLSYSGEEIGEFASAVKNLIRVYGL
jgi:energy-coupling factor transporter ATP-binding protein EcfA2